MSARIPRQEHLDRPVEPHYREHWAWLLGQPLAEKETGDAAALLFRLGGEWFGLPLELAASVMPMQEAHRVPHRGGALLGLVNVGGRLTPAVSLPTLLGIGADQPAAPAGRHVFARLLIVAARGQHFALPVDEIDGIARYRSSEVRAAAVNAGRAGAAYVHGVLAIAGRETGLLDAARLCDGLHGVLR
jgi:chemotaxis-related protein WspD